MRSPGTDLMDLRGLRILMVLIADKLILPASESRLVRTTAKSRMFHPSRRYVEGSAMKPMASTLRMNSMRKMAVKTYSRLLRMRVRVLA